MTSRFLSTQCSQDGLMTTRRRQQSIGREQQIGKVERPTCLATSDGCALVSGEDISEIRTARFHSEDLDRPGVDQVQEIGVGC